MSIKEYKWIAGTRFKGSAQEVGEALAEMDNPTTDDIFEKAKADERLGRYFPWDEKLAAQNHWISIAEALSRSVVYKVTFQEAEKTEPTVVDVRAFQFVTVGKGKKSLVATATALSAEEYRKEIISGLRARMASLSREIKVYEYMSKPHFSKASKYADKAVEQMDLAVGPEKKGRQMAGISATGSAG